LFASCSQIPAIRLRSRYASSKEAPIPDDKNIEKAKTASEPVAQRDFSAERAKTAEALRSEIRRLCREHHVEDETKIRGHVEAIDQIVRSDAALWHEAEHEDWHNVELFFLQRRAEEIARRGGLIYVR